MTYRSILVHVDDTTHARDRVHLAAQLAHVYPAQLVGTYLVPRGDYSPFASAMLPHEVAERRVQQAAEAQLASERMFREVAGREHPAAIDWRAPVGDPLDAAVINARYADLALIGQPARDQPYHGFMDELAHALLMESGRPVLFVPYTGVEQKPGERVLIAWKDSRESARAVADALPFLKDAKTVLAVAITPGGDSLRDALTDKQIEGFLARHEVQATVKRIVAPDVDAGELLLSHVADIGADLIVMGGYSRPRLRQMIWGGVTKLVFGSMTVPVLMSH
jgi:nucleotide-binding universal stress UspA family protein